MITPMQSPTPQQGPVQPQAQVQPQQGMTPPVQAPTEHTKPKPSGREGQVYNPELMAKLEDHLNKLPPEQQKYLTQFMTPELAIIFGIVLGHEAFDYFKKFADPKKQLVVQPSQQGQQPPQGGQPPQQNPQPQQAQGQLAQAQPQQQPSAPPARSIMGR